MRPLRTVDVGLAHGAEHVLRNAAVELPEGTVTVVVGPAPPGGPRR